MKAQKTAQEINNNQNQKKQVITSPRIGFALLWGALIICLLWVAKVEFEIRNLKASQQEQNQVTEQNITNLKKVYVYDLQETLRGVNLEKLNKDFEKKINIINDEVTLAHEKISSLKETKEKDNFSEVYLKSLKLKRDSMIQDYNEVLEKLTAEINRIIAEIADEKDTGIIFDKRVTASLTKYVEDVTPEVIKRLEEKRAKIFNE